jgi:hypothetical protein
MCGSRLSLRLILALLFVTAAACGAGDAGSSNDPEPIPLSPEPVVSIGEVDGDTRYEFGRVVGGVLLGDGGFVILENQAREVRRYGPDGEHVASFGRQGSGPGEFSLPVAIGPGHADSVHVWDLQQRRLTTMSTGDGGVRTQDFGAALGELGQALANLQGILRDGTLVVRNVGMRPPPADVPDGVHRFPIQLVALTASGAVADRPMAVLAGDEIFHLAVDGRAHLPVLAVSPIWGLTSPASARGDRVVFGASERIDLALLDGRGDTVRVLTGQAAGRSVDAAEVDSLRSVALDGMDAPGFRNLPPAAQTSVVEPQKVRIRQAPAREVTPAFDLLRVDSDERTWVRLVGPRFAPNDQWLVSDRTGEPLGAVTIPAGFQFLDARDDRLLGVRPDELGVPLVQVWEVRWR